MIMTIVGDAPEAPPGQERWPGHSWPCFDAEPLGHLWPAGASHLEHIDADEAEKRPTSHAVHTDADVSSENLPASHLEHAIEPCLEYLPASQGWHAWLPAPSRPSLLYSPAAHSGGRGHCQILQRRRERSSSHMHNPRIFNIQVGVI